MQSMTVLMLLVWHVANQMTPGNELHASTFKGRSLQGYPEVHGVQNLPMAVVCMVLMPMGCPLIVCGFIDRMIERIGSEWSGQLASHGAASPKDFGVTQVRFE